MSSGIKSPLMDGGVNSDNNHPSWSWNMPRNSFLVLFIAIIANGLAHSFFFITMPPLGRKMGLLDTQTGMILGMSALLMTFAAPIWGHLCERWGRRSIIVLSLISATVFIIATAIAIKLRMDIALGVTGFFVILLTFRLLNSIGIAGFKPGAQAYIADITSPQRRTGGMGLMGAMFGVGTILGGLLAAISGESSVLIGFLVIAGALALTTVAVALYLPETLDQNSEITELDNKSQSKWPIKKIWPLLSITLLGLMAYSTLQQVTSLRLQDTFGVSSDHSIRLTGMIMMLTMVCMIVAQIMVVKVLSWRPPHLLLVGSSVSCIAMIVAILAPSSTVLMLATAGVGAGLGLLLPGNLAAMSLLSAGNAQARVAGINGMSQGLGLAAGPIVASILHQVAPTMPYIAAGFVCLLMVCLSLFFYRQRLC